MSFPFNPAFMNTGPSHLIRLYVAANAIALNASEAIKGSPSPFRVLTMMPIEAPTRSKRPHVSVLVRVAEVAIMKLYVDS